MRTSSKFVAALARSPPLPRPRWTPLKILQRSACGDGDDVQLPHVVDDAAVGNNTVQEVQEAYYVRRDAMVKHFRRAFEKKEILSSFWGECS